MCVCRARDGWDSIFPVVPDIWRADSGKTRVSNGLIQWGDLENWLEAVAFAPGQSGGVWECIAPHTDSPHTFVPVTSIVKVPSGGSQHLLLLQQEHIMMCSSLLMSEEGMTLTFHIN